MKPKRRLIKHVRRIPDILCSECAIRVGGQWPEGHIGTSNLDFCGICEEFKETCDKRDWYWPND
jgi:hypothetical protein